MALLPLNVQQSFALPLVPTTPQWLKSFHGEVPLRTSGVLNPAQA
jgi:hypothetical protein